MSDRERANALLAQVPDYQIRVIIAYLQGVIDASADIPNDETIAAMKELDEGKGQVFTGSTADMIASILAEED